MDERIGGSEAAVARRGRESTRAIFITDEVADYPPWQGEENRRKDVMMHGGGVGPGICGGRGCGLTIVI